MKYIAILFTALLIPCLTNAQDIIEFKKGEVMEVRVIEVNEKTIRYEIPRKDGQGPIYEIDVNKVKQVQYENGTIDNFKIVKEEYADVTKAHLLEFNVVDLAWQRASLNYEYFPTEKRDFSIIVPVRMHLNPNYASHFFWNYRPIFETGVGGNMYLVRRAKINYSMGIQGNYAYARNFEQIWQDGFWQEVRVDRHFMGFYASTDLKINFRPRIGMNIGLAGGWRYRLNSSEAQSQGKFDLGVFFRF